ncbi:MAG: SseB family protein [Actinomycetota bacterium]|nr:SseB family protein [Actinomycetota bacterium]
MSDTGQADPRLAAALVAYVRTGSPADRAEALAAMAGARLFAAVTATSTAEHVEVGTGLRAESTAEMALLTLVGNAGGRAVPLFLDPGAAVAFRPGARPVPLPGPEACAAALEDGAVAVLVDPPGAALVVAGADLRELAGGRVPVVGAPLSTARTATALTAPAAADEPLLRALADALRDEPVRGARLLAGPDGPVLGVVADVTMRPAQLAALAARVLPRAGVPDLALAEVPADGPGLPVPLRRRRRWVLRRGR